MLDLTVKAEKENNARGSIVDISSKNIQVVSAIDAGITDALQLTTDSLKNLNAESLLLGGVRTTTADGYSVATNADKVTFANDASKPLQSLELIATANESVSVLAGASIETLALAAPIGNVQVKTTGDGALLAVSSLNDIDYSRSGATKTAGTLQIAAGANVQANRSMVLDASFESDLSGNTTVGDGGSLTLGANRILLGETDAGVSGLRVSDSLINSFW